MEISNITKIKILSKLKPKISPASLEKYTTCKTSSRSFTPTQFFNILNYFTHVNQLTEIDCIPGSPLTYKAFKHFLYFECGIQSPEHVLNLICQHFDPKNLGEITVDNFLSCLQIFCLSKLSDKINYCFNLYDLNKTGVISVNDINFLLKHEISFHDNAVLYFNLPKVYEIRDADVHLDLMQQPVSAGVASRNKENLSRKQQFFPTFQSSPVKHQQSTSIISGVKKPNLTKSASNTKALDSMIELENTTQFSTDVDKINIIEKRINNPENLDFYPVNVDFIKEWLIDTSLNLMNDTTLNNFVEDSKSEVFTKVGNFSSFSSVDKKKNLELINEKWKHQNILGTGTKKVLENYGSLSKLETSIKKDRIGEIDRGDLANDVSRNNTYRKKDSILVSKDRFQKLDDFKRRGTLATDEAFLKEIAEKLDAPVKKPMKFISKHNFAQKVKKNGLCLEILGQVLPDERHVEKLMDMFSRPF